MKKAKKYNVFSPDGFTIENNEGYLTPEAALNAFEVWKKRFEAQGYYSSNKGRIPLSELQDNCTFE